MSTSQLEALVERAREASKQAYAPYSKFSVGAAVLDDAGHVHVGCNVENATYGATVCAERNAVAAMVVAGGKRVTAVAVVTPAPQATFPCGICRQVLAEFADDPLIVAVTPSDRAQRHLSELLPERFSFET